ncbi:hypothetical protein FOA52_010913 [Chlamydomonas sp. UWO 241]|nr:hypothetical protein FOA52_010913 [Chlamydomonas sp. UWO 241]
MRLLIAAQGMQTALMGTLADSPGSDPHASCAATDERFSLEPSSPGGIAALVAQLAAFQEESDEAKLLKREQAVHYAKNLRDLVAHAVNAKYSQLRALQSHVASSDALKSLIYVAQLGEPCGYEALQILCYRNAVVCQQLMEQGIGG